VFFYRNSSLGKHYCYRVKDRVERERGGSDETMTAAVTSPHAGAAGHPDTAGARICCL